MFVDALLDRTKGAFKLLALAFRATFQPYRTGQSIKLGDKADFNFRLTFFLAMGALAMAMQGLVAGAIGLKQMPGSLDVVWEYLQPWFAGVIVLAFYLPLRLFGFTRAKFSEFFQVAATNMGPGIFFQLAGALAVIVTAYHYGVPGGDHPQVAALLEHSIIGLKQCLPRFDSYYCLGLLTPHLPKAQWTNYLVIGAFCFWCIAGLRLFRSALGIAYWKQTIAFWIMIAMLIAVLGAVGVI